MITAGNPPTAHPEQARRRCRTHPVEAPRVRTTAESTAGSLTHLPTANGLTRVGLTGVLADP